VSRLKSVAGFVISAGSFVVGVMAWFSPTKFEAFELGFVKFLIGRLWPELFLLFVAGLLLLLPLSLWKRLAQFLRSAFIEPYQQVGIVSVISIILSLPFLLYAAFACVSAGKNLYAAGKWRFIYDRDFLVKEYRHSVVHKVLMYERYAQLDSAVATCEYIVKRWNTEHWSYPNSLVDEKKAYLQGLIQYSRECFAEAGQGKGGTPERSRWSALIKAVAIFPEQPKLKQLTEWHEKLTGAHTTPRRLIEAVKKGDMKEVNELYEKWNWYLFDDSVRPGFDLYRKQGKLLQRLRLLASNVSETDFQAAIERSWELEKARTVIEGCKKVQKMTTSGDFFDQVQSDDDPLLFPEPSDEENVLPETDSTVAAR
jgi:hypothetical protein